MDTIINISPLCIICLQGNDTIKYSGQCKCTPVIHTACLDEWFKTNNQICPICRKKYSHQRVIEEINPDGLYCCLCVCTFIPIILTLLFI
jgi:hypothetical protein